MPPRVEREACGAADVTGYVVLGIDSRTGVDADRRGTTASTEAPMAVVNLRIRTLSLTLPRCAQIVASAGSALKLWRNLENSLDLLLLTVDPEPGVGAALVGAARA